MNMNMNMNLSNIDEQEYNYYRDHPLYVCICQTCSNNRD